MRYLSIYENEGEVKDFLYQNDFITKEEYEGYDFEPISVFEGDPDWIDIKQEKGGYLRVYFAEFHRGYLYEGEPVCITTACGTEETEVIKGYLEGSTEYTNYFENTWDSFNTDNTSKYKCAYRGGSGYFYNVSYVA